MSPFLPFSAMGKNSFYIVRWMGVLWNRLLTPLYLLLMFYLIFRKGSGSYCLSYSKILWLLDCVYSMICLLMSNVPHSFLFSRHTYM